MRLAHSPFRLLLASIALSVSAHAAAQAPAAAPPGRGIDPANMDTTCRACRDFYRYANGGWLDANPIPPDRAAWSSYNEAGDRTTATLRDILEEAARKAPSAPGTLEGK